MSKADWEGFYEALAEQHAEHCESCSKGGNIDNCQIFKKEVERADDMYGSLIDKTMQYFEARHDL